MPIRLSSRLARSLTVLRAGSRRPRRRLRVEPLEDRAVPAAQLAVTPLTWDAIGLDSNDVTVGPNQYLVGVRVTNTGDAAASNVATDLVWDSANADINLTDSGHLTLSTLAAGASQDFFFNVQVTRDPAAYNTFRKYHVAARADGVAPVTTPDSATDYRQLFVEKLLSQNRNSVVSFTGPTNVSVGQTVTYTLTAKTSTAYPQLDMYSGFDNRMFQIESVAVTYDNPAGDTNDTFYANATVWGANPAGASYNTTTSTNNPLFPGGKVGGNVVTTVTAKIVGTGTTTLYPTINDFSGSSFHYNADYAGQTITVTAASPAANLHLTKNVDNPTPNVGDTVTYTLNLSDLGPSAATGVQVTDQLPAGLTFLAATPTQGAYNPATGVWTVGAVANGASTTLTVTARVDAPGATTNTAVITASDLSDPDPSDNTASATVTPNRADLHLTKAVDNAAPNVGDTVNFTLNLSNTGPNAATGVRVADQLPAGLSFVSASPTQGTYDPTTGTWAVGSVANGGSATMTVKATVTSPNALTNTAVVTADVYDPNPADDTGTATVTPQRANLGLTKSVSNATPNVGDTVTYTVTLTNQGPDAATNVQVSDALPVGLALVAAVPSQGTYTGATGLWTVGALANGASATLTVTALVTDPNAVTNIARVTRADQFDPDPSDNSASAGIAPQQAELSLTKTVDNATPNVGNTVTFTIALANAGPNDATDVAVADQLPAGLAFVSATPTQGTYDPVTGIWTVGTVSNGGTATLTLTATVTRPDGITNLARISTADQYDPDGANNSGTANVTPQQADLSVTKTVDNATPGIGDTVEFTITLSNAGPDAATGVVASDLLPGGLQFVSVNPSQGAYDPITGDWNVGTVANGGTATLTIDALVTTLGSVTNVARVTASDEYDPDTANNAGSASLTGESGPVNADLGLAKAVDNATPNVGDTVNFTVTLSDLGPDPATGVVVSDALPAGLTFVSANATQGAYDSTTGVWTVGDVDPLTNPVLTVTAVVAGPSAVTNIARITASDDPDPNPGNDSATATVTPNRADLHLTKAVDNAAPNVGDTVTFTLTLTNQGPNDATGVNVTDQLPAGLAFVGADPGEGLYDPVSGVWTVGTVPNGATATLTVTAVVTSPATATNFAQVTASDVYDPDTSDNTASATTNPPRADLSVTKAVDNASPNVGDVVTFTMTVTDTGPDDATGVRLSDVLPAGLAYQTSNAAQGTYDPATGVWAVGDLADGATATLTVTAQVLTSQPVTNVVQVLSLDQYDPNPTDDRASRTLTPAQADLAVSKSVDVANPVRNQVVTFTVTVTNTGPNAATNVQVTDPLPAGLAYQSSGPSQGTYDPISGIWTVGDLANGATATLTVSALVTDPGPLTNVARITAEDQFDSNASNDQAQATVTGQATDLAVEVTATPTTPSVGGPVTFTVTLTNQGPQDATGVTVSDLLPPGITFVSDGPGAVPYDPATGAWTIGFLPAGQTVTLTLTGTVTGPGTYTDTAQVAALDQFDTDLSNNQSSDSVRTASADLHLTKTVDNANPNVGDMVTFTLTLTNTGPDPATGVAVTDLLPAGLTYDSSTPGLGNYFPATGVWAVGSLADGATATLTVVATVSAPAAMTNVATVTADDVYDPNPADNSGQATVTPQQSDLRLTKTVDNAAPNVGDAVTFTLTVTNVGPDAATSVAVVDQLPAGLTFVSANASQGGYDSTSGTWTVGTVAGGGTATVTIVATVTDPAAMTNRAQITHADQYDPDPSNNSDQAGVTPQQADLAVDVGVSDPTPKVGETVTITVTLSNNGPDAATNVTVTDLVPAGLSLSSFSAGQGSYDSATGVWTVGTVPSGGSTAITLQAVVTGAGVYSDAASVTHADQYDPDLNNNADTGGLTAAPPTVSPPAPLNIDENSPGGTSAGTLAVAGVDPSDALTWALLNDAGGRFTIVGNQVEAAPGADLNYEESTTEPIRVQATDQYGNVYAADLIVGINDVNEVPVNAVPGQQFLQRNGSLTFSTATGNALAVADVDRPGSSIRVTLSVPAGTGTLKVLVVPMAVTVTGNGTGTVTITGTPLAITQAMNGLVYKPATGFVGSAPLTMATNDLGHGFFPNPLTDTDVVPIQVQNTRPVPTVPKLSYQMNMATMRDRTQIGLNAAHGMAKHFTDANGDPLTYSILGAKPAGLVFKPNGAWVYTPPVGFIGTVKFRVRAFDGLEFSDPITVTINVVYGRKPCGR